MLLSIRSFRRRSRLVLLVLIVVVLLLVRHYRAAFQTVYLPQHERTGKWSKVAQDGMRKRLKKATDVTSAWWWHRGIGSPDELLMDISNNTLGFQEIFVINLPSRTDRRDAMALAAGLTGLQFTFSHGVDGQTIQDRILPADSANRHITPGNKGSWRAHMNVLRSVIERNLTSALIVEDDIDWDVRLKTQMASFALAARAFNQPLTGTNLSSAHWHTPPFDKDLASPSNPEQQPLPRKGQQVTTKIATADSELYLQRKHDVTLEKAPKYELPTISPYGDDWDVLWLGHCGTEFPTSPPSLAKRPDEPDEYSGGSTPPSLKTGPNAAPAQLPLLRITLGDDITVPEPADLKPHPFALPDRLGQLYPPHTRVVHASSGTLCTQAYAVSQRGARKLLYQFGLESFTNGWDLILRDWCDGMYRQGPGAKKRRRRRRREDQGSEIEEDEERKGLPEPLPQCLTVQPPLFSHYLTAKEANSDIQAQGGGFLHKTGSQYIRLSVQKNFRRLVNGVGMGDLWDQWPGKDEKQI